MIASLLWPGVLSRPAESSFHVQLGDLATWLLAVLALGALIAAGLAYNAQRTALADQRRATAELARQATALADQAELQRKALADQQTVNALQARVLERNLDALVRQQAEQIRYDQDTYGAKADGANSANRVIAANESARPIRNVVCRLREDQLGEHCTVTWAGRIVRIPRDGRSPPIELSADKVQGERVSLIRRGETWGFVFPIDAVDGQEIPALLRFTDDAGLHWQVNNDLHLEQLGSRDW